MSILLHGDCLEHMKSLDDNSVDFIFCDLPYGQTSCAWDTIIPWEPFWKEIMRVKKLHTPIFFTTTTKFGVELINNAPKKCPFRYDIVWVKSAPAGFLSAKKMPMRKHEMVYAFYEKLPFYDLSSHKHKFVKEVKPNPDRDNKTICYGEGKDSRGVKYTEEYREKHGKKEYDPPLPVSVVKEEYDNGNRKGGFGGEEKGLGAIYQDPALISSQDVHKKNGLKSLGYDPPLPVSVVKEVNYQNTTYGNLDIPEIKDRKNGESRYDPPLPVSVVKEEDKYCDEIVNDNIIKDTKHGTNTYNTETGRKKPLKHTGSGAFGGEGPCYDPPLPNSLLEIKSTRGKHSTEKPVALMEWLLKYYSKEGDVVLDPTMGSGSTGVACKNMNRNFIGIEKDGEIYEVAVNRIEN